MTAFATALAISAGVDDVHVVLLAIAVLVGQFSVGWANDAIDGDRDRVSGRTDKPVATGEIRRGTVLAAAKLALIADVPLSLAVGPRAGAAHLAAVGWAWHYNGWLKSTVASWLPYAIAFGLVPVVVAGALPGGKANPRLILVVAGALCGVAAHFANTVGDASDDAITGIRGLPQRIGETRSTAVGAVAVCVASVVLDIAVRFAGVAVGLSLAAASVGLLTLLALGRATARRLAFRLVLGAVGLLIVGFVSAGGHQLT